MLNLQNTANLSFDPDAWVSAAIAIGCNPEICPHARGDSTLALYLPEPDNRRHLSRFRDLQRQIMSAGGHRAMIEVLWDQMQRRARDG